MPSHVCLGWRKIGLLLIGMVLIRMDWQRWPGVCRPIGRSGCGARRRKEEQQQQEQQ